MTPEPALWNWRSRGLASGGASKNRLKNGSSRRGLRCDCFSLMVPRVAMLTTAGEARLTIGASDGMGESAGGLSGRAAWVTWPADAIVARMAAAGMSRSFMRDPKSVGLPMSRGPACNRCVRETPVGSDDRLVRPPRGIRRNQLPFRFATLCAQSYTQESRRQPTSSRFDGDSMRLHLGKFRN